MERSEFDNANIIYLSIVLAFFAAGMLGLGRAELFRRFKMLIAWGIIILVVTAGYIYWPALKQTQFFAGLVPGSAIINEKGEMEFQKAENGHFLIDANVNGKDITFMVDTGASDIVFSQKDAEKIGVDPKGLIYNKVFSTANGLVKGASAKISYLKLGSGEKSFEMQGFYASINQGELDSSLLGMKFLNQFKSYHFEGNRLILKP